MTYNELINKLETIDLDQCFPIYVPSHLRPNWYTYKNIISALPKRFRKKNVHYIVRDEMYKEYKAAQPDVDIVVIPKEYEYPGYGLDTTRKFLYDYALSNGDRYIFDFDDDIDYFSACYSHGENTRRLRAEDRKKYLHNILAFASVTSLELMTNYEKLCFGTFSAIHPNTCEKDHHKFKAVINSGQIPRQALIIDLQKLKNMGAERNGSYDRQAEDQGMAFNVVTHGGWTFYLPTLLKGVVPADPIKNKRTEQILFNTDSDDELFIGFEDILKSNGVEIKYASKFKGQYKGINWTAFRKDHPEFEKIVEEW